MVLINDGICYIFTLTDDESAAVHTDTGIAAVEVSSCVSLKLANAR